MGLFENYMVFIICTNATVALATCKDGDDTSTQITGNWPEQPSHNLFAQPIVRKHQEFYDEMLELHNEARAKHDAKSLTWNYSANTNAMKQLKLIIDGKIEPTYLSEYLCYYQTYISKDTEQETAKTIFDYWYNEGKHYDYKQELEDSNASKHFTQIVWKATRSVGFAFAYENRTNYFVAMYVPRGNFTNMYTMNVGKPRSEDD